MNNEDITLLDECLEALCCLENLYCESPDLKDRDWIDNLIGRLQAKIGDINYFTRK